MGKQPVTDQIPYSVVIEERQGLKIDVPIDAVSVAIGQIDSLLVDKRLDKGVEMVLFEPVGMRR